MNFLHPFLIFSVATSIYFFEFCWIKPSQIIEAKIYVKNGFKAANTTFVQSKLRYAFLTMKLSNKAIKNEDENSNRNNINTWASRENSRILRHFPFHLEFGMFRQVIITNLVFRKLPTSLSCVQYPHWLRVRGYQNQRINKQKSDREKYKHTQRHNKIIWETGYRFEHPKIEPKWTSLLFCSKYIYVELVHFNRQNSFSWGKIP